MLKITDLIESKEMGSREMAGVRGGLSIEPPRSPFTIDFGTRITSKVADVTQAFDFAFAQGNTGAVTNNQAIAGGNGVTYAPVDQTQHQYNDLYLSDIGNVHVS